MSSSFRQKANPVSVEQAVYPGERSVVVRRTRLEKDGSETVLYEAPTPAQP